MAKKPTDFKSVASASFAIPTIKIHSLYAGFGCGSGSPALSPAETCTATFSSYYQPTTCCACECNRAPYTQPVESRYGRYHFDPA